MLCIYLPPVLHRDWCDDERTGFTDNLCSSLLQLLPLLQLTRSAASLHWVLRLVAFFSSSSPSTSQRAATACFTLLLKLARQVEQRKKLKETRAKIVSKTSPLVITPVPVENRREINAEHEDYDSPSESDD